MTIHVQPEPVIAILAGGAILAKPEFLNYVVAGYLILVGILGLLG